MAELKTAGGGRANGRDPRFDCRLGGLSPLKQEVPKELTVVCPRSRLLILISFVVFFAIGCPGAKGPNVPPSSGARTESEGPLSWAVSKSGLGFRIRDAD